MHDRREGRCILARGFRGLSCLGKGGTVGQLSSWQQEHMVESVHITVDQEAKNKVDTRGRYSLQRPDVQYLFLTARLQLRKGPQPPKITSQAEKEALKIEGCGGRGRGHFRFKP